MFGSKYLLLELEKNEADFYHLPVFVPYMKKYQKNLKEFGFEWELAIEAMKLLVSEMDVEEYKPYKLFIRKWDYYNQLTLEIKNEEWHEAERTINKILSIDLLDPSAYLNLGFVFRHMEKFKKAEQAYKKGLELLPDNPPFMGGLARTYDEWENTELAIEAWQRVYDKCEEKNEALEMLEKYGVIKRVESKDPKTKEISVDLIPAAKYDEIMHKEFENCGEDINALTKLGLKLTKSGKTKLAMKVFAKVYKLSKDTEKDNLLKF